LGIKTLGVVTLHVTLDYIRQHDYKWIFLAFFECSHFRCYVVAKCSERLLVHCYSD